MSIEAALYYHLTQDAAVAAIVGTAVYPRGGVPQDHGQVYLVWEQAEKETVRHQMGVTGLVAPQFGIRAVGVLEQGADAQADPIDTLKALASAVEAALDGYSGTMGTGANATTVEIVEQVSESEGSRAPVRGEESGARWIAQEYSIWHRT